MNQTAEAIQDFFKENNGKLTIGKSKRFGWTYEVTFDAPHIQSLKALSNIMRTESTNSFLLIGVRQNDGVFSSHVVPKTALELITEHSNYIGSEIEKVLNEYCPIFIDEQEAIFFNKAITELYDMAELAESLSFQCIARNVDPLLTLCEYKEDVNYIFDFYKRFFDATTHHKYAELLNTLDLIEL